jgi:undecaprenyl-diphosphatase
MSEWLSVILLGIIEGLTEFIPVSSTGHLQLAERWLRPQSELFDIVIQCGAVLAVLAIFHTRVRNLIQDFKKPANCDYVLKLLVAFLLTIVGVLAAEKLGFKVRKEEVTADAWAVRVATATLIGGILFLMVEWWLRGKSGSIVISWPAALAVGAAQILAATYSGTSRSGATILFALILGISRPAATEFSFLLGVPTLLAAGAYKFFKAWKHHELARENWGQVLLATIVATIVAYIVVKWLLRFVQTHTFIGFAWYRIALGILILIMMKM